MPGEELEDSVRRKHYFMDIFVGSAKPPTTPPEPALDGAIRKRVNACADPDHATPTQRNALAAARAAVTNALGAGPPSEASVKAGAVALRALEALHAAHTKDAAKRKAALDRHDLVAQEVAAALAPIKGDPPAVTVPQATLRDAEEAFASARDDADGATIEPLVGDVEAALPPVVEARERYAKDLAAFEKLLEGAPTALQAMAEAVDAWRVADVGDGWSPWNDRHATHSAAVTQAETAAPTDPVAAASTLRDTLTALEEDAGRTRAGLVEAGKAVFTPAEQAADALLQELSASKDKAFPTLKQAVEAAKGAATEGKWRKATDDLRAAEWGLAKVAARGAVYGAMGKAVAAVKKASGEPASEVFKAALAQVPQVVAMQQRFQAEADVRNVARQRRELDVAADDVIRNVEGFASATTSRLAKLGSGATEDQVATALTQSRARQFVADAYSKLLDALDVEIQACGTLQEDAGKKYAFKSLIQEAGTACETIVSTLTREVGLLETARTKDWAKASFIVPLPHLDEPYDFELEWVRTFLTRWETAVAKLGTKRETLRAQLDDLLQRYKNQPAITEREKLECQIAAVQAGLLASKAQARVNELGSRNQPKAVWEKVLRDALEAQKAEEIPSRKWFVLLGLGSDGSKSWGIDSVGVVDGINCHLTAYPKAKGCSVTPSVDDILDAVLGTDVTAVHVTQELHGTDDQRNPHYYRGGEVRPQYIRGDNTLVTALQQLLAPFETHARPIVQGMKDRHGLTVEQVQTNAVALQELQQRLADLG